MYLIQDEQMKFEDDYVKFMFLLVEGKVVMKKVLNITICLIGIALLYIGAVWNEKFIEHQFLEFDQIVSESGDNITFNLPEFDNQIILISMLMNFLWETDMIACLFR